MVSMTETPSGNRWEPGPPSGPRPEVQPAPGGSAPPEGPAGSDGVPVEWPAPSDPGSTPPSYDVPVTAADGSRGRRRGLLVAGVALVVLASGATGYAIGTSSEGSGQDQVTRQGQPPGSDDGAGPDGARPGDRDGDDDGPPGTGDGAG
jgi:hypothetical protein